MNSLLKILLGNLVLSKGPQDFPFSLMLMRLALVAYFITGFPSLMTTTSFEVSALAMALDTLVLLLFVYLCLQGFKKSSRFVQTVTSLASIGAVFQLAVLPLLYNLQVDGETVQGAMSMSLLLLMFVSWNLAVYAHIFRESFNIRLPAAVVLTICYVLITVLARKLVFPDLG